MPHRADMRTTPRATLERLALAYDGSDPAKGAANVAFALASGCRARVTLLHVRGGASMLDQKDLEHLARRAPPDVRIETRLLDGDPGEELQNQLLRERVDLVVAGTRGTGRLQAALLGSVSRTLLDGAPCAVLLVRDRDATLGTGPVLIGVDDSPQARAAAGIGALIAAALRARLVLVHVLDSHVPFIGGEQPAGLLEERDELARRLLADVVASLPLPEQSIERELRTGAIAGEQLLAACAEHEPRLVIVGHRSRGRFVSELVGSTAREIADHAPCPVIISRQIRPPGIGG